MVDARSVVVATGRRHPHEVFLLVFSTAGGVAFLSGATPPSTLERLLPDVMLHVWYWTLLVGGLVGLVGSYWRGDLVVGLALERGAMLLAAAASFVYVAALLSLAGAVSVGACIYVGSYALACLVRAVQITRDLRRLRLMRRGRP